MRMPENPPKKNPEIDEEEIQELMDYRARLIQALAEQKELQLRLQQEKLEMERKIEELQMQLEIRRLKLALEQLSKEWEELEKLMQQS
ncbi:unnamed protein product [Caenorhabditis angaria]|uniref:Uncharacterized protein n=1 Tax=Caenorhabditis angaria TaxID=860376 RepID=A0A9P1MTQ9_9PELO|nr:unnamed protein product [Caenorhabditis angaria]